MYKLPDHRTKKITLWLSLASILAFATLIALQAYTYHEDTPQAQCYASIDFIYSAEDGQRWSGKGDMSINMEAGEIYLYFNLKNPQQQAYLYNRRLDVNFEHLDSSRFLFKTLNATVFESDNSIKHTLFMRRGLEGGLITFSRFSDVEYYYNINNILTGVCHVPT